MAALRDPAVAARVEALAERFTELREDMRDTFAGAREFLDFIQHWAAVVATQLEDTTTAQATITALVQRTLGLRGLSPLTSILTKKISQGRWGPQILSTPKIMISRSKKFWWI